MAELKVVFHRDADQKISGRTISLSERILEDAIEVASGFRRDSKDKRVVEVIRKVECAGSKKIVLINGYTADRLGSWRGKLPADGEVWFCELVRDTMPEDSDRGALIVRLKSRLNEEPPTDEDFERAGHTVAPKDSMLRALNWKK